MPDESCGYCVHPVDRHRNGTGACRQRGCPCGEYDPPGGGGPELEPRRRREPSGPPVVVDPAAQAEVLRQVEQVDEQLAGPEPEAKPDRVGEVIRAVGRSIAADMDAQARRGDRLAEELAEERREHQATALLLAEQRHVAERIAEQQRETVRQRDGFEVQRDQAYERVDELEAERTEALRELGRERAAHRTTRARVGELEATVARMVEHFDAARAGDPARVLFEYDADHCLGCGFRTTVPGLKHAHPLTPVTVLVVERSTAEADAEATNPNEEK